jgi:3'-phosphoadenosine 5'-phosphosulfate sulfotransferase (PAPS reductase)/FAD synthetase
MDFDIHSYDYYLVQFSGGKDSTACLLHLLDLGVPRHKIELWHSLVDGKGEAAFMDWEVTKDYCKKFARAFDIPIYFNWKQGGFKREMLRNDSATAPCFFETPYGLRNSGGEGSAGTRLKFPQVSPNLNVRWCSAYLKIDVASMSIRNQPRFKGKRTLVISGERAEESSARANYKFFEPDRTNVDCRFVDRCRIIHQWKESDVWGIIQRWGVVVHPCYYIGYNRCSCKWCIFGNDNQFATSYYISPMQGRMIIGYEREFKTTIKRDQSVPELIETGKPYEGAYDSQLVKLATSYQYNGEIFTDDWVLPRGAYGENFGPN